MKTKYILLPLVFLISFGSFSQTQNLYTVSPAEDSLWVVDTATFTPLSGIAITSGLGTVTGCNGLAVQDCTGDIYIVMKISGVSGRVLGIVDPATGIATTVGNMGQNVAGICFGDADHLYAVTGDGAAIPESLFKVNLSTGAMTLFTTYGNGNDGENISFCRDNGKIYHWSGLSTQVMEATDTLTGATTNVPLSGFNYSEVQGSVYIGNGVFILTTIASEVVYIDITGFAVNALFGTNPNSYKGLGFPTPSLNPILSTTGSSSFCPGDSVTYDVTAGASYQWFLNGSAITGATTQSYTVNQAGLLNAEVTSSAGCLYSSDTVTLSLFNIPNVGITPTSAVICAGDSLLLTASGGGSSQWYLNGSPIAGATSNSQFVSTAGIYNMVKTNMNGCSDSSAVSTLITVSNLPNVTLTPSVDTSYCVGDSVLLTGSAGGTIQWYVNGTVIPGATTNTYFVSSPGYYNMFKTNTNGCSDSSAVGVNVVEDPCGVGIAELIVWNSIALYPSPVKEQLTISFDALSAEEIKIKLYTVNGEAIESRKYTTISGVNKLEMNTESLAQGVYLIRIVGPHGSTALKFIK